jgi:hypothetical protein
MNARAKVNHGATGVKQEKMSVIQLFAKKQQNLSEFKPF